MYPTLSFLIFNSLHPQGQDDDDDYDFAEDQRKGGNNRRGGGDDEKTQKIENHHYDEAVDISEGGSGIILSQKSRNNPLRNPI